LPTDHKVWSAVGISVETFKTWSLKLEVLPKWLSN